jgi:hypothetical protein
MTTDRHTMVAVFTKGQERYVWVFPADQLVEACRSLGRFAANPELSLTWCDAADIADSMNRVVKERLEA